MSSDIEEVITFENSSNTFAHVESDLIFLLITPWKDSFQSIWEICCRITSLLPGAIPLGKSQQTGKKRHETKEDMLFSQSNG
jgi:hypothetical protein